MKGQLPFNCLSTAFQLPLGCDCRGALLVYAGVCALWVPLGCWVFPRRPLQLGQVRNAHYMSNYGGDTAQQLHQPAGVEPGQLVVTPATLVAEEVCQRLTSRCRRHDSSISGRLHVPWPRMLMVPIPGHTATSLIQLANT